MLTNQRLRGNEEDRYSPVGNMRVNYIYEEVYFQATYLVMLVFLSCRVPPHFSTVKRTGTQGVSSVVRCYNNHIPVLCSSMICVHFEPAAQTPSTASTLPYKTHPP